MLGPLIGAGVVAAACSAGYQSMAPTGQWFGRTFTGLARGSKQLALTYDDGPNDPHTLRLLEVLAKHNVKATFFLIGRFVERRPEIARAVAQAGHAIGNHTFTHPNLIFVNSRETRVEIERCTRAMEDALGATPRLFRPPFGGRHPRTLGIARSLGLEPVMWNITGYDWNAPPAEQIVARVSRKIGGGEVILLHDGGHRDIGGDRAQTVIATERILERWKAQGFEFTTIPQMMGQQSAFSI